MFSLLDDPPCFDDAASCDPTLLTQMKSLVSECWVGKENVVELDKLNQVWWNSKFTMSHWIPINKTLFLKVSLNLDVMLALFGEDMSKKNEYEFVYSYTRQQFYRWGAFPVLSPLQFLSIRPRVIHNGFPQIFRVFDPTFAFCSQIQQSTLLHIICGSPTSASCKASTPSSPLFYRVSNVHRKRRNLARSFLIFILRKPRWYREAFPVASSLSPLPFFGIAHQFANGLL